MTNRILLFIALFGLAALPAATADDAGEPGKKPKGHFKKADLNRDGVVDDAERAKADELKNQWSDRKEKADANQDGTVDKVERKQAKKEWLKEKGDSKKNFEPRRDRDNNPPGKAGGPGTNWENPPGPKGGPGASPDKHKKK